MSLIPLGFWAASGGGGGAAAYDLLETQTLASSAASVTFSSIPADYKHLQIRALARSDRSSNASSIAITVNNDTSANYVMHRLYGNGSSVTSQALTARSNILDNGATSNTWATGSFGASIIDILDYSNTNKNTTIRIFDGKTSTENWVSLTSGLWLNTSAITEIDFVNALGNNWVSGSRFSLIGIR